MALSCNTRVSEWLCRSGQLQALPHPAGGSSARCPWAGQLYPSTFRDGHSRHGPVLQCTDGVSAKPEAKRCAANIHKIAISYVDKIMTTKWQREKSGVRRVSTTQVRLWSSPLGLWSSRGAALSPHSHTVGVWGQASCRTYPSPSLTHRKLAA
jgi:hypothetical protein